MAKTEPIRRRELWIAFLTISVVLIAFLVSEFAGRMRTEEADTVTNSVQFA